MSASVDPFTILGIEPDATEAQVGDAYQRLAQIFHPDRYATAPDGVRAEAERRMKEINQARDAIKTGYRRAETTYTSPEEEAYQRAYAAAADYSGPYCLLCGHAPVTHAELKTGVGKLFSREVRSWTGELCRGCGQGMYREAQNETMIKGWWGIISFFANIVYIIQNWSASRRIAALGPPIPTPRSLFTPISIPLPPSPPLTRRAGVWVTLVLFSVLGYWFVSSANIVSPGLTEADDCFSLDSVPESGTFDSLTIVDCDAEGNVGQIFAKPEYADSDSYPGDEELSEFAASECERIAEYQWDAFIPTEAAWDQGERQVLCYYPLE